MTEALIAAGTVLSPEHVAQIAATGAFAAPSAGVSGFGPGVALHAPGMTAAEVALRARQAVAAWDASA